MVTDVAPVLDMIRVAQDAKFGDFQANFAMPLSKQLGKPPREIAQMAVDRLEISDLCDASGNRWSRIHQSTTA